MAILICKWFIMYAMLLVPGSKAPVHPFYVSVTEINHNQKEKTLEISCKMFTDDMENTINREYKTNLDLLNSRDTAQGNRLIADYIARHLHLVADGKKLTVQFVGYEKEGGAIWSYLQVNNVTTVKKLEITNDLLYESFDSQIGILHVTVNNVRKSTKLNNPVKEAVFNF